MPVVKLSQYPKYSVPLDLKGQITLLQREVSQPWLHNDERMNALVCTLSISGKLIAFSEVSLADGSAQLTNLIVQAKHQKKGLGTILLTHTMKKLVSLDHTQISAHCEPSQFHFFQRLGFTDNSNKQTNARRLDLLHPCVDLTLAHLPPSVHTKGSLESPVMQLGEDTESYHFRDEHNYLSLHQMMLSQARKRIWLLCDSINNPVLNNELTTQSLKRMIQRNPQTEIRILVADDKTGAGYFNPCISLAQKLSSYIEVRTLQKTGVKMNEMITLVDYSASIFRKSKSDYAGFACFHNRVLYERMRSNFDNHWQFAKPSMQLRRLAI